MSSEYIRSGLLLCLLGLCACSVREDRSACPCLVSLDCTAVDAGTLAGSGCEELRWTLTSEDFRREGTVPADDLGAECIIETPRGAQGRLTVTAGDDGRFDADEGLLIPEGESCPPLLACILPVDASPPEVRVPVVLYKRHAVLEIRLRGLLQPGMDYVVRGGVCGYGPDLEPLRGPFRVPLSPDGEGWCRIALPAQTDGTLSLCVYRYGELDRIFAIGEYILDSGYDWEAPDLGDITLEIDYVDGAARINIDQWSKTLYFTIAV